MRREDVVSWPGRLRGGLYTYSNICSSYVTFNVLSVLRPVILCHAVMVSRRVRWVGEQLTQSLENLLTPSP